MCVLCVYAYIQLLCVCMHVYVLSGMLSCNPHPHPTQKKRLKPFQKWMNVLADLLLQFQTTGSDLSCALPDLLAELRAALPAIQHSTSGRFCWSKWTPTPLQKRRLPAGFLSVFGLLCLKTVSESYRNVFVVVAVDHFYIALFALDCPDITVMVDLV